MIEGRWYVTERAANDYVALMRPRQLDLETATEELIVLGQRAHFVRHQDNGLDLWRVKVEDGRRLRLLVGEPPRRVRGAEAKPALVTVLDEHDGGRRRPPGRR